MFKNKGDYPLTVGNLIVDNRLGNFPRYYIGREDDCLMQIPDEIRKSVAFVCFADKDGIQLAGTAFFVVIGAHEIGYVFGYVVTAKHVIVAVQRTSVDGKALLRVNMKAGPSQFVETRVFDWQFHPNEPSVDVAVLPLWLPRDQVDFLPIPVEMAATNKVIQDEAIGVGDDVFLTGLFVNHVGRNRNLPIVRAGNIALMPEEPVQTAELGPIDAFLVETRSIGGLSGSPVFVYTGSMRLIGNTNLMGGGNRFYWLGLMHGHWSIEAPGHDDLTKDAFENERVNMGIAIVVPVSRILEVINQEVFVKARQQKIEETQKATLPQADTMDAPLTKEAFEDTLKKVNRPITPWSPGRIGDAED